MVRESTHKASVVPLFHLSVDPLVLALLIAVAFCAGILDTLAGGGGILTMPSLLLAGIAPHMALGTNRMQALIGEFTAIARFVHKGALKSEGLASGIVFTALGAWCGTMLVHFVPREDLEWILPIMMLAITIYSVFSRALRRVHAEQPRLSTPVFMLLFGGGIGFYNGFFGPGTGSLWLLAFVVLMGMTVQNGSIHAKPLNVTGNVISAATFFWLGQVDWTLALLMGGGQIAGALVGSHLVLNHGQRLIRPVFLSVTLVMTLTLMWKAFAH